MQFKLTKEFIERLSEKVNQKDDKWILECVFELHHADIADVLEELSPEDAKYVYYLGDEEVQADILMDLQDENRDVLIDSLSTKEIADQIENLDSDDAADILGDFPEEKIQEVISQMDDDEAAEDIVDLLNYDEDTAGGLMQKEFCVVQLNWPVNQAIMQLRKQAEDVEKVFNIFVVSLESAVANPLTPVNSLPSPANLVAVNTPVTTAPDAFACTLTLPPAVSFNDVTSIPVKLAPVIDPLTFTLPTTSSASVGTVLLIPTRSLSLSIFRVSPKPAAKSDNPCALVIMLRLFFYL